MGIDAKHAYRFGFLRSKRWDEIRTTKLLEKNAACMLCGHKDIGNDVHHIRYPKNWADTKQSDLVVLCRVHHNLFHRLPEQLSTEGEFWRLADPFIKRRYDICNFRSACRSVGKKLRKLNLTNSPTGSNCHATGNPV